MHTEYVPSSTTQCINDQCRKMFPTKKAVWIAEVFTACSTNCGRQFLQDRAELVNIHAVNIGLTLDDVRERLTQ